MKSDITFLRALYKELHFLNEEERNDFVAEYRTKIDERYQKGENLKRIVGSFEHPKTIAKKIYAKQVYTEDRYNINNTKVVNTSSINWLTGLLSLLPQLFFFIISLILILAGLIIAIASIPVFVLCWVNFDPLQAVGPAILALGLMPLIGLPIMWIGKKLFAFEWFIFKTIWAIPAKKEAHKTLKIKKGAMIASLSIFTALTLGGGVGSFAGDKTIGGAAISGNLLHTQTETLDLSEFTNISNEPIKISFAALKQNSWYGFTFVQDWDMESNLQITRAHNTKENLKMKFTVEKDDSDYRLKVNMPWNLLIFNISSNKFTLRYNPTKIDFGV